MSDIPLRPVDTAASRDEERELKTLRWDPNVSNSTPVAIFRQQTTPYKRMNTSVGSPSPPGRRRQAGDHLFIDSSPDKTTTPLTLPHWLVSCGKRTIDPNAEEYHVESWSSFHKKYSSSSYRAANSMTFSEIRKQQKRKVKPSWKQRILQRLSGQSQCASCGSIQCDGSCSIYSNPSKASRRAHPKKKQPLSPFRRAEK